MSPGGEPCAPTNADLYTYDANGNLTSDGTRAFTYDVENRLLSASAPTAVALAYDPLGRLNTTTAGGTATQFLYSGEDLVAEYVSGALTARYVQGPETDEALVWYDGSAHRFLHADPQGSIVAWSDASGNVTSSQIYTYGPYGEPAAWGGSRFQYTGQIEVPEAQLDYYKARVYDPMVGRFLQTDPVGYTSDVNLYAYVGNDPTNRADPSGDGPEDALATIGDAATYLDATGNPGAADQQRALVTGVGADLAQAVREDPVGVANLVIGALTADPFEAAVGAVQLSRTVTRDAAEPVTGGEAAKGLPKPRSGPGSVPKAERDPRRTFSPAERAAKRDAQGEKCANGCGKTIDSSNSQGHHIERHADGGRTDSANHAEVCKDCHADLHTPE